MYKKPAHFCYTLTPHQQVNQRDTIGFENRETSIGRTVPALPCRPRCITAPALRLMRAKTPQPTLPGYGTKHTPYRPVQRPIVSIAIPAALHADADIFLQLPKHRQTVLYC